MALMQMQAKHNHKHSKTWMQQGMMKLHAKPSKFHVEHAPNGHGSTHTLNTSFKHNLPKTATMHFEIKETTFYRKHMATNLICTEITDYILQITTRFMFIGIRINPVRSMQKATY